MEIQILECNPFTRHQWLLLVSMAIFGYAWMNIQWYFIPKFFRKEQSAVGLLNAFIGSILMSVWFLFGGYK